MTARADVIILGGGLAGLSISYRLLRKGVSTIIIEAKEKPGGLLESKYVKGFTFDTGGSHIIFSKDHQVLEDMVNFIGRENLVRHRRNTFIYYKNRFVKYPFENGIYMLDPYERYEILRDTIYTYIKREKKELKEPSNLYEWFYYVFGRALSEKYLIPYNEKIWKRDLRDISLKWVGNRVPLPPLDDILKSAVGIPTEGYTHQLFFYYPVKGGIKFLADKLVERISKLGGKIVCNNMVERVKCSNSECRVKTRSGTYMGKLVISTIPLNTIYKLIDAPEDLIKQTSRLSYNSLIVVGLGIKGENRHRDKHWIYFPDKNVVFHRIAFLSNYSPTMAPKNYYSIIAEITVNPADKTDLGENLVGNIIDKLVELGFIKSWRDVVVRNSWLWKYGYVVYDHNYSQIVYELRNYLIENKIIPFGRFGEWEYLNMDHIWSKAIERAEEVVELLGRIK